MTAMVSSLEKERGVGDPMICSAKEVRLEPRRVVVEMTPDEFQLLNRAAGRDPLCDYLKLLALRELSG